MKNIYDITKGQMITVWIFGFIGVLWIASSDFYAYNAFVEFLGGLFAWGLAFAVVFYTIGWRNKRN